jgi:hypothetical protein
MSCCSFQGLILHFVLGNRPLSDLALRCLAGRVGPLIYIMPRDAECICVPVLTCVTTLTRCIAGLKDAPLNLSPSRNIPTRTYLGTLLLELTHLSSPDLHQAPVPPLPSMATPIGTWWFVQSQSERCSCSRKSPHPNQIDPPPGMPIRCPIRLVVTPKTGWRKAPAATQ